MDRRAGGGVAAQRTARRDIKLFTPADLTPADRFQSPAREVALRPAARPFLAALVRRFLNREGERL